MKDFLNQYSKTQQERICLFVNSYMEGIPWLRLSQLEQLSTKAFRETIMKVLSQKELAHPLRSELEGYLYNLDKIEKADVIELTRGEYKALMYHLSLMVSEDDAIFDLFKSLLDKYGTGVDINGSDSVDEQAH
jgi:hypothetical protein